MNKKNKAFTLIELLVVISIIGVLTTLVMANFNAARQRARDTSRKSDLKNISTSLRLYYNDMGIFPASSGNSEIMGCGSDGKQVCTWGTEFVTTTQTYMSTLPNDPTPGQSYSYTRVDLDTYEITACLENKSDDKAVPDVSGVCDSEVIYILKP